MSRFVRLILKLGPPLGNLIASAVGGLVFTRGFRLVAMDTKRSDSVPPIHVARWSPKSFAGIDAAIFLLAFVASEALATIGALRH